MCLGDRLLKFINSIAENPNQFAKELGYTTANAALFVRYYG